MARGLAGCSKRPQENLLRHSGSVVILSGPRLLFRCSFGPFSAPDGDLWALRDISSMPVRLSFGAESPAGSTKRDPVCSKLRCIEGSRQDDGAREMRKGEREGKR